jgi:hypothetical protein
LASQLEARGHEQERVARFLMRVVFCCFAEDIDLLPNQVFRRTLVAAARSADPAHLQQALGALWRTMDTGGLFGAEILKRFNGHFFQTVEALPLDPADAALLLEAAQADWAGVEPTIFGSLLVRALDPVERHRLGAEYTPRAYIERLIEPTVLEPIRERWTAVQAEVIQLEQAAAGKARPKKADAKSDPLRPARERLNAFHEWLCGLRFLDPACGSGNFLYVTMAAVKRIELEDFREMERLVALHDERVAEERRGLVLWLRPDYQIPRFGQGLPAQVSAELDEIPAPDIAPTTPTPWPDSAVAQLTAITALLARGPVTPAVIASAFSGAKPELVARHLETLAIMGEALRRDDGSYVMARRAA